MISEIGKYANLNFSRISPHFSNAKILRDRARILYLRKVVTGSFKRLAKQQTSNWWESKKLLNTFKEMYLAKVVELPEDPVERLRWLAIMCYCRMQNEGFNCSDLLTEDDFLASEMLKKKLTPRKAYILKFRGQLRQDGWDKTFDW